MLIGIILSATIAGMTSSIGLLLAGRPVLQALVAYPLAGLAGAAGFVALAMLRSVQLSPVRPKPQVPVALQ